MKYWLWVWRRESKIVNPAENPKNGWDFDTREKAELFFNRHFRDEPVQHEITEEKEG